MGWAVLSFLFLAHLVQLSIVDGHDPENLAPLSISSGVKRLLLQDRLTNGTGVLTMDTCADAAAIVATHFAASKRKAAATKYNLPTFRIHVMSACSASDNLLQDLVPILRKYANASRLKLEFIGSGDIQTGLKSLNGPAEVMGDYYLMCHQRDHWSGAGKEEDYLSFLSFVDCLAGRRDSRRLPLEACSYIAGSSSGISRCLDDGPYLLEKSFKFSQDAGINESPTIFLEWPARGATSKLPPLSPSPPPPPPSDGHRSPVPVCGPSRRPEDLEAALCAALVDEAVAIEAMAHWQSAPRGTETYRDEQDWIEKSAALRVWQSAAAAVLRNVSQGCDGSGTSKALPTCRDGAMDGAMLVIFYLLPGVLIMFVLCFGVSSFSRIFRLGVARHQQPGGFERFSFQLAAFGADVTPTPSGAGANQGLDALRINSIPTSTPDAMGITAAAAAPSPSSSLSSEAAGRPPEEEGLCHCSICVDEIDGSARVFALKCRHVFHQDCLRSWLEKKNECPVCRQPAWQGDNVPCETAL